MQATTTPTPSTHVARRPAFTLLELLVTIGAVAVVAVGLAAVFGAVGDAVATGRRVSRLTQYSRMIEAQLRKDFESMSRDGFLVIRQQYADANGNGTFDPVTNADPGDGVRVGETDTAPRLRRVDEIIFFAHGDFVSNRAPLPDPNWVARSDSAMIYYGHGEPLNPDTALPGDPYYEPKVNFAHVGNDPDSLGRQGGINRFAGRWTLLRHATLLCPVPARSSAPSGTVYDVPLGNVRLLDKDCQIAGQPAMASIFRAINSGRGVNSPSQFTVTNPAETDHLWYVADTQTANFNAADKVNYAGTAFRSPMLTSGVVDIATTSLEEIKQRLLGFDTADLPSQYDPVVQQRTFVQSVLDAAQNQRQATPAQVDVMHAWMDNAFPGPAANINDQEWGTPYASTGPNITQEVARRSRIRCEERAVDLLGAVGGVGNNPVQQRQGAFTRADRLMLPMHNLAQACSEFSVEWTFGQMDTTTTPNELVWHGLVPPPVPAGVRPAPAARPYDDSLENAIRVTVPLRGVVAGRTTADYVITERLLYGNQIGAAGDPPADDLLTLTSYFGQIDPVFNPDSNVNAVDTTPGVNAIVLDATTTGNQVLGDATDAGVARVAWPWPTLIRVRITLADPVDPRPETEQTFEYVFEVPSRDGT